MIGSKTITTQLNERNIKSFIVCAFKHPGSLGRTGGRFYVCINDGKPRDQAFTLGHEIGHTFDTGSLPGKVLDYLSFARIDDYPPLLVAIFNELHYLVEEFCNAFAQRWIAINSEEKVVSFLGTTKAAQKNKIAKFKS